MLVGSAFEQVSVEACLLSGLGVQGIELLPILLLGRQSIDEVHERRVVTVLGEELVGENTTKEGSDGDDRTCLQGRVSF